MKKEEIDKQFEAARALFNRENLGDQAMARFREIYPHVDKRILGNLVFHLFIDGHEALLGMLHELEMFMRGECDDICEGQVSELLNHMYNYMIAKALLPAASADLLDYIKEAREALTEDPPDLEFVARHLETLDRLVDAWVWPSDIERPF